MDKLGNNELILIMIEMKKQYEKQYKIIEDKFNSLQLYCNEQKNITLLNSGVCNCCNNIIFKICEDSEFENECCFDDNYFNCHKCDKIICNECMKDYNETLFINKKCVIRCKKCNDFNIKMKELK